MRKEILIVAVLTIIIVILVGVLLLVPAKPVVNPVPVGTDGLQITSPGLNAEVSSPIKIIGKVTGNGWGGFEGQVGNVRLLDEKGNQIGLAILTATDDWMQPTINFKTYLQFSSDRDQAGKLVFTNENPSDMRQYDRQFILPVKIKKSSGEIMTVKVFFNNNAMDPEISCNKVFAVNREVPKTTAVARVALDELLKGVTLSDVNQGFFTSINSGVKIQKLTIVDGIANVDFDEQLQNGIGGSCRVAAIRSQIEKTLKQFSTVKDVIISINGKTEDILQP